MGNLRNQQYLDLILQYISILNVMDFTWFGFIAFYFSSPREHPDKNLRPPGRTTARTAVQIKYVLRTAHKWELPVWRTPRNLHVKDNFQHLLMSNNWIIVAVGALLIVIVGHWTAIIPYSLYPIIPN